MRKAARETRCRRDLLRLDQPGDAEALDALRGATASSRRAARARLPVQRRGDRLHRRARARCSSSSRTATPSCASLLVNERQIDPAQARCRCCTTTARRSPRASSPRRSPRTCAPTRRTDRSVAGRPRHDLHRQAQAAPSRAAEEHARLHAARLRRHGLDAVRRLRPRLDLGRDHPGLLGAGHRAAPRRQALRHRLLVEDARLLPRRSPRLQHRARPHALGADRRQPRQPRPDLPRRLAATATPPRSASASSPTPCGAA